MREFFFFTNNYCRWWNIFLVIENRKVIFCLSVLKQKILFIVRAVCINIKVEIYLNKDILAFEVKRYGRCRENCNERFFSFSRTCIVEGFDFIR